MINRIILGHSALITFVLYIVGVPGIRSPIAEISHDVLLFGVLRFDSYANLASTLIKT